MNYYRSKIPSQSYEKEQERLKRLGKGKNLKKKTKNDIYNNFSDFYEVKKEEVYEISTGPGTPRLNIHKALAGFRIKV